MSAHNKSFFDNPGDSDEEEKNGLSVSRTSSYTNGTSNVNNFRKSVVNLGIDHKMLMNATSALKTGKVDSTPTKYSKLSTKGIDTIQED